MSKLVGTRVIQPIVPNDSLDTYPTHTDIYGKGGYVSVDTVVDRNSISLYRQKVGMSVYVTETSTVYTLNEVSDTLTDANWSAFTVDGGVTTVTSTTEPANPIIGLIWLNSTTGEVSMYTGTDWRVFVYKDEMISDVGSITLNGGYF